MPCDHFFFTQIKMCCLQVTHPSFSVWSIDDFHFAKGEAYNKIEVKLFCVLVSCFFLFIGISFINYSYYRHKMFLLVYFLIIRSEKSMKEWKNGKHKEILKEKYNKHKILK